MCAKAAENHPLLRAIAQVRADLDRLIDSAEASVSATRTPLPLPPAPAPAPAPPPVPAPVAAPGSRSSPAQRSEPRPDDSTDDPEQRLDALARRLEVRLRQKRDSTSHPPKSWEG